MGESNQLGSCERNAFLRRFRMMYDVGELDCTIGLAVDAQNKPTQFILLADKLGEIESGLLDCLSRTTSLALREGVTLDDILGYWSGSAGFIDSPVPDVIYGQQILAYCASFMRELGLPRPENTPELVHPDTKTLTHRIKFYGSEFMAYMHVAYSDSDGKVYGVHLDMAQDRTFPKSLSIGIADVVSLALKHGMPLEKLVKEWKGSSFAPRGFTENPDIPFAKSVVDYAARYIESKFMK